MLKKITGRQIINILIWLSIMTSSFDIVLSIRIAGMTFRFTQIVMIFVAVIYVIDVIRKGVIRKPVSIGNMIMVIIFNTIFIFNSLDVFNAVGYDFWLMLDFVYVLVMVHFFSQEKVETVVRNYIICFFIMGIIGLIQWLLQFFDIYFFVTQISNMYRCNGFSYEPSYYSTYMIMGWTVCAYLLENNCYAVLKKHWLYMITGTITIALILSTSRMGWLMMALWFVVRLVVNRKKFFTGKMKKSMFLLLIFLFIAVIGGVYIIIGHWNKFVSVFLQGLGIFGTASHSSSARIQDLYDTFNIFKQSPWIGYSLGGLDAQIAKLKNIIYAGNGMTMCITVEALAAFGIIGFAFFARYFYTIFKKSIKLARKLPKEYGYIIKAVLWALVMELGILQMNQNILRVYLWIHIGIVSVVYFIGHKKVNV